MKRGALFAFSLKRMAFYLLLLSAGCVPLQWVTPCGGSASGTGSLLGFCLAITAGIMGGTLYRLEKTKPADSTKIIIALTIFCAVSNTVAVHF